MFQQTYTLSVTTQGPLYPPSEIMDEDGNFVVIGAVTTRADDGVTTRWTGAVVSAQSPVPAFGERAPYTIIERFEPDEPLPKHLGDKVLHTLPLPLPCNNYPMVFAPQQYPDANTEDRPSYPLHRAPIPDFKPEHGRQLDRPVTLAEWVRAAGTLTVTLEHEARKARFSFTFSDLLPRTLYTIMTLREHDLDPAGPTRPGPLGVPNVFVTDRSGGAAFEAVLPNPFPDPSQEGGNRVINVVVLCMSSQMSHGGAIGRYGLGGDIHAQLKFPQPMFHEFTTRA